MVKDLPQGRGAVRSPRLLPIDGVERLVDEEAEGAQHKGPRRSLDVSKSKTHTEQMQSPMCLFRLEDWSQTGLRACLTDVRVLTRFKRIKQ